MKFPTIQLLQVFHRLLDENNMRRGLAVAFEGEPCQLDRLIRVFRETVNHPRWSPTSRFPDGRAEVFFQGMRLPEACVFLRAVFGADVSLTHVQIGAGVEDAFFADVPTHAEPVPPAKGSQHHPAPQPDAADGGPHPTPGRTAGTGPSGAATPPSGERGAPPRPGEQVNRTRVSPGDGQLALAELARRVREERRDKHGTPEPGFSRLGELWRVLLAEHTRMDIPPLDGWVVACMLVGLKLQRAVRPSGDGDDFTDAYNFLNFAFDMHRKHGAEGSD